jgi:nonsense-mediated mRNA decay protein 3
MKPIGYYEGILQLRNPTKELINFVKNDVKKNDVKIAAQKKVTNGADFYLTSNAYLLKLGKRLQSKFGAELKTSRKLFSRSRQTGKQIWRVTVLIRLPLFKVGDVIRARRKQIKVTEIGKKLHGIEVETGKKIMFRYEDIK